MDFFEEAKKIFAMPRPHKFMDEPNHCEECQEVEAKAQQANPDTLTLDQAGHGWADLHNFLNNDGFLYYFPAFIRLCVESNKDDGFLDNFIFAITYDGENNRRLIACSAEQRKFIHKFLNWYKNVHSDLVDHYLVEDDFEVAIQLWSE